MVFTGSSNNSYLTSEKNILVKMLNGRVVYKHPNEKGRAVVFNLPEGMTVTTSNNLTRVKRTKYVLPTWEQFFKQFPRQHKYDTSKGFQIVKAVNPNKASIYLNEHKCVVDREKALQMTYASLCFVLFHERGHYYYRDEDLADLFAAFAMLKMGFNMYDCLNAQIEVLGASELKIKRMLRLILNFNNYESK